MTLRIAAGVLAGLFTMSCASTGEPRSAVLESSLESDGDQIRRLAFDGDAGTYFASKSAAKPADHFTMTFDEPILVRSVRVESGRPDGARIRSRPRISSSPKTARLLRRSGRSQAMPGRSSSPERVARPQRSGSGPAARSTIPIAAA